MKKSVRLALLILMCAVVLCCVACLSACSNTVVDLRVENAKISFMKGDEFETGENFKVYAEYKDGSSVDVTQDVEIRQETGMDMNVAGDYQITVVYGNKRTIYTVYVNDSEDILRKIELDTANVTKQYCLGDSVSLDGIVLNLTYENAQGIRFNVTSTSLVGFNVAITNADGAAIDKVFTSLGKFTVTVSQAIVKASYEVTVDGINISTVQGAIAVGGFYKSNVKSGDILVQGAMLHYGEGSGLRPGEPYKANEYNYVYGNNYTYYKIAETEWESSMEYHGGIDEKGFFMTYLQGGSVVPGNVTNADMMDGAPIHLWYSGETAFGAENALKNLYSHALNCSNDDLKEEANESTRTYKFSFSGLEFRNNNNDYYETTVTFTLNEDYSVASVTIDQYYYENNSSLSGRDDYVASFTTDSETGKTTPGPEYTYRTIVTVTQTSGERTAENPYTREMFKVSSYNLKYNGEVLNNDSVIELNAGGIYKLTISDVLPATADFALDMIYFDYQGNTGRPDFWLSNEHFALSAGNDGITISAKHGGTWTLIFRTEKTVKKLTVDITGEAPEEMSPKLYNNVSGTFYDGNERTVSIGAAVYFYGSVNSYANAAQNYVINSDNAQYATVTQVTQGGVDCFKFTATQAGTYQISVVSNVAPLVRCIFTFTVNESVDFAEILSGTYTAQDRVGDVYNVTFAVDEGDTLSGTVTVVRTPTDLDNNPLTDQAVTQTLNLYVDGMSIMVDNDSNNQIWVEFAVDENNNLVLVDQRGNSYELTREQ